MIWSVRALAGRVSMARPCPLYCKTIAEGSDVGPAFRIHWGRCFLVLMPFCIPIARCGKQWHSSTHVSILKCPLCTPPTQIASTMEFMKLAIYVHTWGVLILRGSTSVQFSLHESLVRMGVRTTTCGSEIQLASMHAIAIIFCLPETDHSPPIELNQQLTT
jgi:hypothetical protein